jgi:hypothetical protein
MRTVADVLEDIVLDSPFLEEGIAEGIINLSALARRLRPRVEAELMKPVSDGALVMALKRMSPELGRRAGPPGGLKAYLRDLTVRSDLCELTFLRSETLLDRQQQLLTEVRERRDQFVTFTQGVVEVTAIFDSSLLEAAESIFAGETVLSSLDGLAAITIRLAPETVHTPGVHYAVLKQLAMRGINMVEVVSTYTELTIILERDHVDRAFSVLLDAASPHGAEPPVR